ncbi:hypothetical protein SCHPADRAFT_729375 [Schizopora paradoxa]|uniref:mRNA cap guanine-N(7) methyltransferase n=1 Tax=Schizopora paradoxa TaxID=27342 RepID=A0A0H2R7B4_9AGAM|nr:hypothetical protein SCHPADRAFT_729375 [Schizopora paradoxa]
MAKELHAVVPDELHGGPGHTQTTDMWAFGMVISELLTKKVPFNSIVESRVPMAILAGDLPREPDFRTFPNRFIFRGLWAVARQCWADDPQCRPSASEVLDELKPLMCGNKRGQNNYSNRSTSLTPAPGDDHITCETDRLENMMGKLAVKDVTTRTVLQSSGARPLDAIHQNRRDKGKNTRQPSLTSSKCRGFYKPRSNGAWAYPTPVIQPLSSGFILDPLQRPDVSVTEREKSPIIGLKFFNNWIKAVLILRYAYPALQASSCEGPNEYGYGVGRTAGRVLDIGCGKGGDLQKWQRVTAREYVGLDIVEVVVEQAKTRYFTSVASRQGPYMGATFACLDCFSITLSQTLHPTVLDPLFDVASMQFCVQNAFESINKVKVMFENVTRWLRKGGVFIGTMLNDQLLLSRLDSLPPNELSFGNAIHQVRFENREYKPEFGHRYWFYVQDAVKFVQEYVVYWETFVRIASEFNLELQYKSGFHEMYTEHCDEYGSLLQRMKVIDADGKSQMDEDQWETANLYIAFAFKKI